MDDKKTFLEAELPFGKVFVYAKYLEKVKRYTIIEM